MTMENPPFGDVYIYILYIYYIQNFIILPIENVDFPMSS